MRLVNCLALLIVLCISCKKNKDKDPDPDSNGPQQKVTFYKANSRGVIANYSVDSSLTFEYYGKFDAAGNAMKINSFNVQSNDVLATYILDTAYKLRQIIFTKNGVKENFFYSFGYNEDTLLVSLVQHTWGQNNDAVLKRMVKFTFKDKKPQMVLH